jgi:hypothetical protein
MYPKMGKYMVLPQTEDEKISQRTRNQSSTLSSTLKWTYLTVLHLAIILVAALLIHARQIERNLATTHLLPSELSEFRAPV